MRAVLGAILSLLFFVLILAALSQIPIGRKVASGVEEMDPMMTFLERCEQQELECSEWVEHDKGSTSYGAEVFHPIWRNDDATADFRIVHADYFVDRMDDGYNNKSSLYAAGVSWRWTSLTTLEEQEREWELEKLRDDIVFPPEWNLLPNN